jgi:hypothetical protein
MYQSEIKLIHQKLRTSRQFVLDVLGKLPIVQQRHIGQGLNLLEEAIDFLAYRIEEPDEEQTDPQDAA